jgi:catechol 2,3-dioxygenase-like lactoylglutathione lyase family enzyme
MGWSWGYVSTVVPEAEPAARFFREVLGLPGLGAGEFTGLGARGELLGLGSNARLAVVEPVSDGIAARHLRDSRGGLCHVALAGLGPVPAAMPTSSPLGPGVLLDPAVTAGLRVEVLHQEPAAPPGTGSPFFSRLDHVAAVVPRLEAAVEAFAALGLGADDAASWFRFPGLGTRNAVLPATAGYLELNQADTADGVFGSVAARQGAGIAGLTLGTDDLPGALERLRSAGVGVTDALPVVAEKEAGEPAELGRSAVVSLKSAHGTRLFLFAPLSKR